ncbi:hypothetical protein Ct61P_15130 [Colletotrichum tofieldiae]|nr:hypothetical protein Ct61P_15130 [Colletotrichum tofieldiae]
MLHDLAPPGAPRVASTAATALATRDKNGDQRDVVAAALDRVKRTHRTVAEVTPHAKAARVVVARRIADTAALGSFSMAGIGLWWLKCMDEND